MRKLGADDDLVSEIIKHERRSPEPVNCDGLNQDLLDASSGTMKYNGTLAIEAARVKAQNAYLVWMEYMTGVVWWSVLSIFLVVRQPMAEGFIRYQERGRDQEVLRMAPDPLSWMAMIPPRPLPGDVKETWYSWNEPGWDIGPAVDMRTAWE